MTRLGLALGGLDRRPFADVLRLALAAEESGYDILFVAEAWGRDATVLLGYLAARTRRVRLATGIVNVFSRSPALLAMAAATLDELSGGRAALGLGVSGRAVVEGLHGIAMERPLRRLRETTEAVRKLLARDRSAFAGEVVRMASGFALRVPAARADLPIYHACLTPAAIRQCGEVADGWLPFLATPTTLREDLAHASAGLARAGRARASFTVAPFVPALVSEDAATARRLVKRHLAFYIGGMGRFYHQTMRRHGFADVADRVRAAWAERRRDAATDAIPDEVVDALSLCGDAGAARARLADYGDAGADVLVLSAPEDADIAAAERTIRCLA